MEVHEYKLTRTAEYIKWQRLNIWIAENTRYSNDYYRRELFNCVTRYFTSLMLEDIDANDVHKKFLEEVAAKKIKLKTDIRTCHDSPRVTVPSHFQISPVANTMRFICGNFKANIQTDRYTLLKKVASDEDIMCMLLNYAIFPSASLSWSIPSAIYKHLFETHGLSLEGCSSPVNSQLLPLGGEFCTPFESDNVFGSKGSVFSVDLEGHVSLLNPPFVEDFMLRLAKKAIDTLDNAKESTTIIYIAPAWLDAESHIMLSNTKWLMQKLDLLKGTYHYEDAITQTKIPANFFSSTIFVLSNTKVDYSDILLFYK